MDKVFSEFEVSQVGFKFKNAESCKAVECVGSFEEELETKTVTKSCRGVVKKTRTRGTGNGTIKLTCHMPYDIYTELYAMNLDTLIGGVKAYGANSVHPEFGFVADVKDEDDNKKLKAYPNCVLKSGIIRKVENGAEEVAEIELEISAMPDAYGNGMYEALVDELTDETVKSKWMTAFDPALVQKATV